MTETFQLKINGRVHAVSVEPETPLLYVLRNDIALNGAKFGCGLGQCGACTVIIGGRPGDPYNQPAWRASSIGRP